MEASSTSYDVTSNLTDEQLLDIRDKIDLLTRVAESLGMDSQEALNIKSVVSDGIDFVEKALNERQVATDESLVRFNSGRILSSRMDEDETMEMGHLFVSNGQEIFVLDINEKPPLSNAREVPPLPIVATLNLIEKGLPVLVVLFKLRSDAYIIGGRKYNANLSRHSSEFCKGTSRDSYRLSFHAEEEEEESTLSHFKGIIGKMNRPKISPIIEEIDGKIHVFESYLCKDRVSSDWIFSHEVLHEVEYYDCNNNSHNAQPRDWQWRTIKTSGGPVDHFIRSHLVVGPRIYALCGQKALLFDSRKGYWEVLCHDIHQSQVYYFDLHHAWEILGLDGEARCALELGSSDELGVPEEVDNRMYVIITLVSESRYYDYDTIAIAYLVNSLGDVVHFQCLYHFFEGLTMKPSYMKSARVIRADEEGRMMCSIVNTNVTIDHDRHDCLFINIFSVKENSDFLDWYYKFGTNEHVHGKKFVYVDIKKRYIYKTEDHLERDLQACFM